MPNRILKESIFRSDKVNGLTDFQFRVWASLIPYVDDFGRGDARPAIINGTCFPLRDRITNKDIDSALHALAGAGCISLYEVDGKSYLCFPRWENHQTIRNKVSKYPAPPETCEQLNAIECNCLQLNANVPVIQSESESESESEGRSARARANPADFEEIAAEWNKLPSPIPKINGVNANMSRGKKLASAIKNYGSETVIGAIRRINRSSFLQGKNDRKWTITFDWFVNPTNFVKVMEGNYDDQTGETKASYDIDKAEKLAKTKVPELRKKEKR